MKVEDAVLNTFIEDLGCSVRLANCLRNAGLATIRDVLPLPPAKLLRLRQFGPRSLRELVAVLLEYGLSLGSTFDGVEWVPSLVSFPAPSRRTRPRRRKVRRIAPPEALAARNQRIWQARVVDGWTLRRIADAEGLSRERIRQIVAKRQRQQMYAASREIVQAAPEEGPSRDALVAEIAAWLHVAPEDFAAFVESRAQSARDAAARWPALDKVMDEPGHPPSAAIAPGRAMDLRIDDLDVSIRAHLCLQNAGVRTVGELVLRTESDLLKSRNFGRKSLKEIKEVLLSLGMRLRDE